MSTKWKFIKKNKSYENQYLSIGRVFVLRKMIFNFFANIMETLSAAKRRINLKIDHVLYFTAHIQNLITWKIEIIKKIPLQLDQTCRNQQNILHSLCHMLPCLQIDVPKQFLSINMMFFLPRFVPLRWTLQWMLQWFQIYKKKFTIFQSFWAEF